MIHERPMHVLYKKSWHCLTGSVHLCAPGKNIVIRLLEKKVGIARPMHVLSPCPLLLSSLPSTSAADVQQTYIRTYGLSPP